ncbi:MAG: ABC transporter ATP-binding protein [Candidatus Hodarchaeales archaeon]|jgi:putative ABC transport system ATP-binding protein
MPNPIITMENVSKCYWVGNEQIHALSDVSLSVETGEYLIFMGPSGSGKTTALNLVGTLDHPSSGEIYFEVASLTKMTRSQRASYRTFDVGHIFQTFNLIESLNSLENVRIPLILGGLSREKQRERALEVLELVGLSDRLHHKPRELSGGQKQRVAIARALANQPRLLLADEPTGNLDLQTGLKIVDLLRSINKETGVTILNSTHDLRMIETADRICWLRGGQVETIQEKRQSSSKEPRSSGTALAGENNKR